MHFVLCLFLALADVPVLGLLPVLSGHGVRDLLDDAAVRSHTAPHRARVRRGRRPAQGAARCHAHCSCSARYLVLLVLRPLDVCTSHCRRLQVARSWRRLCTLLVALWTLLLAIRHKHNWQLGINTKLHDIRVVYIQVRVESRPRTGAQVPGGTDWAWAYLCVYVACLLDNVRVKRRKPRRGSERVLAAQCYVRSVVECCACTRRTSRPTRRRRRSPTRRHCSRRSPTPTSTAAHSPGLRCAAYPSSLSSQSYSTHSPASTLCAVLYSTIPTTHWQLARAQRARGPSARLVSALVIGTRRLYPYLQWLMINVVLYCVCNITYVI